MSATMELKFSHPLRVDNKRPFHFIVIGAGVQVDTLSQSCTLGDICKCQSFQPKQDHINRR